MSEGAVKSVANGVEEDVLDLKEIISISLKRWRWYATSLVLSILLAVLFVVVVQPEYTRTAELLVKSESNSLLSGLGGNSLLSGMLGGGSLGGGTNINNEIITLKSPATIAEVVRRLDLRVTYAEKSFAKKRVLYGVTAPFIAVFDNVCDKVSLSMEVKPLGFGELEISNIEWVLDGEEYKSKEVITTTLNKSVDFPFGEVEFVPNTKYVGLPYGAESINIVVTRISEFNAINDVLERLEAALDDKFSTVIKIDYSAATIQLTEDFINTLIDVYNEKHAIETNESADNTLLFVNERIAFLEQSLRAVEAEIAEFKSESMMPDIMLVANLYMKRTEMVTEQLMLLNSQLIMSNFIYDYISDESKNDQLLPANLGISSEGINAQITEYNTLQMHRRGLLQNSNESNPVVITYGERIEGMRGAIISSIENNVLAMESQIAALRKEEQEILDLISDSPKQAEYLISAERQRTVIEALYVFLLQKQEEAELSRSSASNSTRIITPPFGSPRPSSPRKIIVLVVAMFLGGLIPLMMIVLPILFSDAVRTRGDLANLKVPFLGAIPKKNSKNSSLFVGQKQRNSIDVVISSTSQDAQNEAFRVVRTNLEILKEQNGLGGVMMVSSFDAQSGKSFVSMNLSASLSLANKRVIVMDADMRNATVSNCIGSPLRGLSSYLNGSTDDYTELISTYSDDSIKVDILPVGAIPFAPTELLLGDRFKKLIDILRGSYDYVVIDTTSLHGVADATIITPCVDQVLFVVKANTFSKSKLVELEALASNSRVKSLAVVLNATEQECSQDIYSVVL